MFESFTNCPDRKELNYGDILKATAYIAIGVYTVSMCLRTNY